jgi:hypothetical protein
MVFGVLPRSHMNILSKKNQAERDGGDSGIVRHR